MARKVKVRVPAQRRKPEPVAVSVVIGGRGWSLPAAADLIRQGYSLAHAERTTGYPQQMLASAAEKYHGVKPYETAD